MFKPSNRITISFITIQLMRNEAAPDITVDTTAEKHSFREWITMKDGPSLI